MMSDLDTAQALIGSIQSQSSLLLSLSTAIIGGTAALAVQLKVRNGQILSLRLNIWFKIGVILLGVSCLSSWFVLGALINKIPVIMSLKFDGKEVLEINQMRELTALTWCANAQFLSFVFGVMFTAVGIIRLMRP